MKLIVMRHGRAESPIQGRPDHERALTPRGVEWLQSQGIAMLRAGLKPDVLACSPYRRARETADLLAAAFGIAPLVVEGLRPGADIEVYAALLEGIDTPATLMTVHHQPDVSAVVYALTGASVPMDEGHAAVIDVRRLAGMGGQLRGLYEAEVMARLG
ncbi:MAG: histidine phosphatase family protein [Rhodothermales bacterium]|nr:histidine phosphatase family protein [Rhodothermales bacterium]